MQSEITVVERQGQFYVSDGEREFVIPRGAEGDGEPGAPSGDAGTAPTSGDGVQPDAGGTEGTQDQSGGQGFIEPYLSDVDESVRPTVQKKLEQFRQDQDAQVTRRFEQMRQETEIPVTVYKALMDDPIGTVQWIAERFEQDRGINLRDQLLQQWQQANGGEGQPEGESNDPNAPLTQAELDRILEEREQQKTQQAQQQQIEQQRIQQQTQTVHSWMDEAAKKFPNFEFNDADGQPDPLRTAIALQANQLHSSGQAKGRAAIEMVVESMAQRFGSSGAGNNNGGPSGEPRTANGGSAPPAREIDVTDNAQRKDRMFELFTGGQ